MGYFLNQQSAPTHNLDLLRMVAVLLVVFDHVVGDGMKLFDQGYTFPRVGGLGVMMFFVHTSLVLMLSMERMQVKGWQLVRAFYFRRLFRIYPLSIVTVLLVSFLAIPDPYAVFHQVSGFELVSNFALIQNLSGARSVTAPLWSLPWEVQMYLALPFLFFGVRLSGIKLVGIVTLLVIAIDAAGVGTGYRVFRILDYVPCFMGGVLAFALIKTPRVRMPSFLWPIMVLALPLIWVGLSLGWPVRKIFYPQWIVSLVLGLFIPHFHDLRNGILATTSHLIAKYSYGIYLFHFPAIWLTFDRFAGFGIAASIIGFLVVTAVLSVTGYYLVEEPMISLGKRFASRRNAGMTREAALRARAEPTG